MLQIKKAEICMQYRKRNVYNKYNFGALKLVGYITSVEIMLLLYLC
jgi:hypothetical protein